MVQMFQKVSFILVKTMKVFYTAFTPLLSDLIDEVSSFKVPVWVW